MGLLNFPSPSPPHLLIIRTLFSATWIFFGAPLLSGGRRSVECAHRSARSSRSQDPLDRGRSSPASPRRKNYTSTRQQTPAFNYGRAREHNCLVFGTRKRDYSENLIRRRYRSYQSYRPPVTLTRVYCSRVAKS